MCWKSPSRKWPRSFASFLVKTIFLRFILKSYLLSIKIKSVGNHKSQKYGVKWNALNDWVDLNQEAFLLHRFATEKNQVAYGRQHKERWPASMTSGPVVYMPLARMVACKALAQPLKLRAGGSLLSSFGGEHIWPLEMGVPYKGKNTIAIGLHLARFEQKPFWVWDVVLFSFCDTLSPVGLQCEKKMHMHHRCWRHLHRSLEPTYFDSPERAWKFSLPGSRELSSAKVDFRMLNPSSMRRLAPSYTWPLNHKQFDKGPSGWIYKMCF